MQPVYEESTGHVIIEWLQPKKNGSPVRHYYSEKPYRLQLHPRDPKLVVRAYFLTNMPGWMKEYVKEKGHGHVTGDTNWNGRPAWWIANWNSYKSGYKPFSSPDFKGSVMQFKNMIPDVVEELKSKVSDNVDVIERNIQFYPNLYEEFGLFYRPEEIAKRGGCLVLDEGIILEREGSELEDDYRIRILKDGKLERLIHELTTPLPEPDLVEEVTTEELELTDDIFQEDELDLEEEIILGEIELDSEEILLEDEISDLSHLIQLEDEDVSFEEEMVSLEEEEITDDTTETKEEVVEASNVELNEEDNTTLEVDNLEESQEEFDLKVITYTDRKNKLLEGQLSLF